MGSVVCSGVKNLRMVVPTIVLFGVAPHYYMVWMLWRLVSLALPTYIYQKGDDFCYSLYQRLVLFFFENLTGTEVILHGDGDEVLRRKERVLYLGNHQSTMDWIVVHMLAERQGSLGHVRYIMKNSLQAVPLYGFYFYEHGCVYVKRGNFNQSKMMNDLKYLKHKRIPTWLVIFPEGTRFNPFLPQLLERSHKIAEDQGIQPFNHLLTPKIRGLHLALEQLRNSFDALYDVTVVYSNTKDKKSGKRKPAPSMFEFAVGVCPQVHIHVSRIDIKNVPTTEEELKQWLFTLYRNKDRILSSYYDNNEQQPLVDVFAHGQKSPTTSFYTISSFLFFMVLAVPFIVTPFGRSLYWKLVTFGSLSGYLWLGVKSLA
ncbi:1-acyl-sn-glycerol-3-phosphate acyltransferase epsilon-like [Limulus polyphemus]|uniref:1-acyl-sn-glycerol-3-phosphate acyltransferase epsilon-like n=1 Tax=Limulus polyphemus TaxID=6850 RepID=A0ABM1B186_LIMPO|nr:1-acyl-sn-glycerol-3-phosphate acyltransferase epsilon-like [Limulus polyphemus]